MQRRLEHTKSHRMHHFSILLSVHARPTPARAFPEIGALSAMTKTLLVNTISLILAWKPRLAMLLGRCVWWVFPWLRGA
jgi:hypothetical protein